MARENHLKSPRQAGEDTSLASLLIGAIPTTLSPKRQSPPASRTSEISSKGHVRRDVGGQAVRKRGVH